MKFNFRIDQRNTYLVWWSGGFESSSGHQNVSIGPTVQKALNDISAWHAVGLYWVPGHAEVRGNEIADELARGGSVLGFLGPQPALGFSRKDIWRTCWLINQHWVQWQDLGDTQRQVRELIRNLVLVLGLGSCPLTGLSPGLLLAFSLDITLWGDIFTYQGWWTVHCVGGVEQRKKPQPTFFVNVRLWPHSDMHIQAPFSWSQRTLRV